MKYEVSQNHIHPGNGYRGIDWPSNLDLVISN
jgi:hypothetical protein